MKINVKDKVLLFDFDGTLVETEFLAKQAVDEYFKEKGFTQSMPFAEMIVGRTWGLATQNMIQFARSQGLEIGEATHLEEEFKRRYRRLFEKGVKLIPGFLECLPLFQTEARYLGIVTGSARDEVDSILRFLKLENIFSRIWAVGDYAKSKPDPSPYLQAMKDLGVEAGEVIVFEDSMAGMEAAFQAKIPFVQITHEGHAKVLDPRAFISVNNWSELSSGHPLKTDPELVKISDEGVE